MPSVFQIICMVLGFIAFVILSVGFYRAYKTEQKKRKRVEGAYFRNMSPEEKQAWLDDMHRRVDASLERWHKREEETRKKQEENNLKRLKEL